MWEIYERLISSIPDKLKACALAAGSSWSMVQTEKSAGVAMTLGSQTTSSIQHSEGLNIPLKELAELVKSWDFAQASIGMAAINAYYNSQEQIDEDITGCSSEAGWHISKKDEDVFDSYSESIKGKKVAVIGHFPNLEKRLAASNQLSILERNPQKGDYPDTACEYILPEQDYVFITGSAFINKTMPRLLQLSKNAKIILVGPSVPIASLLFEYGVSELGGFIVTDPSVCKKMILDGSCNPLFVSGERIRLYKK